MRTDLMRQGRQLVLVLFLLGAVAFVAWRTASVLYVGEGITPPGPVATNCPGSAPSPGSSVEGVCP